MICPNCNLLNENEHMFCVNCGTHFTNDPSGKAAPTVGVQMPPINIPKPNYNTANSVETEVLSQYRPSNSNFQQPLFTPGANYVQPPKKSNALLIGGGLFVLLLLLIGGGAAVYFASKNSAPSETLPAHFGLFFQNQEKNAISEIKKQDFTSVLTAKDELAKNENLPNIPSQPNFVLYAENNDIPLNDLKLVQLDSVKDDGTLKQLDIQAAPVEGKPEMKRIRIPESLANGKYAFALFDGFFDDGKHKMWAFSVKNDGKTDNGDLAKNITLNLKPKEDKKTNVSDQNNAQNKAVLPPTAPVIEPPAGAKIGFVTQSNVVMRSGSSQFSSKIGGFKGGQKVYVLNYSSNYESFKNLYSNYAYVQTESGKRGWIYAAYLR